MKRFTINMAAVAAFSIIIASPALVSSSCATPKAEQEDTTIVREDPGITALKYSSPEVPANIEFCGKVIDLTRFDRHERMDRELLAFTYMHSTSLQMLKKANRYFPIVEPILKENGIPDDFKYLMVIESNMNPTARSSAGAAGLWQFMQGTGRDYGLEVNSNIDERYHVEKATHAACRYLKDAYAKYHDWVAVAASYNAGQARIASQLAKQDVDDSLDLQLVEETARYVYRILAAKQMFSNPAAFGFRLRASDLYPPIPYTEVTVTKNINDLARFARSKGITLAILKNMNPWLRETSLSNHSGWTYVLKIPTKEGMTYHPQATVPHDKRWVVE
ncbi:lytic transglycosylase domain-containing protein [Phocaeicola sp.]